MLFESYRGTSRFINSTWCTESLHQQFIFRIYRVYRVLRFIYSDGGLHRAYRVLRFTYSDGRLYTRGALPINLYRTCRFSGYHFSAKIPERGIKIDQKFRNRL